MAQSFDITLKHLFEAHPADCLRLVGYPTTAPVEVIDADLATVTAEADKVIRVNESEPWLMHFEMQASYDAGLPERMLRYNVLLHGRHNIPVRSIVLLLRPKADGPNMSGVVRHTLAEEQYLEFRHGVSRIWKMPVEEVLNAGVGVLPMAPLAATVKAKLPEVIEKMKGRLDTETARSEAAVLWMATYVLMGLRYDEKFVSELLKGVRTMEESVTYQAIIKKGEERGKAAGIAEGRAEGKSEGRAEGKADEARRIFLRLGKKAFGEPDEATERWLDGLSDPEQIESLIEKVVDVKSWRELIGNVRSAQGSRPKRKS